MISCYIPDMNATERNKQIRDMEQWEQGRRSVLALMTVPSLTTLYETCGDEQHYYRAQMRCAGRTEFYTPDRIAYFRERLDQVAETRKQIRAAIKQRNRIRAAA